MARSPFLYAEVPRIMSFSTWPMTLRQNRVDTFPLTPVGRLALSGRWVAMISTTPNAGPILITNSASSPAAFPWSGWANRFCASSMMATTGHSLRLRLAAICRVTRLSGHRSRGSALSRSVRRITSARSSRSDSAAYPIDSSSTPDTNRYEMRSIASRSPEPLSSCTHISASGSSATPHASTRTAAVLPCRGMLPSSQLP